MCKVSDKLKLCTCAAKDASRLKNYWEFYRFDAKKEDWGIVGEIMAPADIDFLSDAYNRRLLTGLLNKGNVFDVELNPKENDWLQLSFYAGPDKSRQQHVNYGYRYKKGKWVTNDFICFDVMRHHNEERFGKIVNAKRPKGFNELRK